MRSTLRRQTPRLWFNVEVATGSDLHTRPCHRSLGKSTASPRKCDSQNITSQHEFPGLTAALLGVLAAPSACCEGAGGDWETPRWAHGCGTGVSPQVWHGLLSEAPHHAHALAFLILTALPRLARPGFSRRTAQASRWGDSVARDPNVHWLGEQDTTAQALLAATRWRCRGGPAAVWCRTLGPGLVGRPCWPGPPSAPPGLPRAW